MATPPGSNAAPRSPLSTERVLRAAVSLADASGIEALSMRRLGRELGVKAMSLYNHVANKDDILVGMVDIVVGEMELPLGAGDWKSALRRSATSAHQVLLRHRWAGGLLMSGAANVAPARLRYTDSVLRCLRDGGFSIELTDRAYHALDSHIIGFTLWQLSLPFRTDEELVRVARTVLRELAADEFPYVAEHIRQHLAEASSEGPSEFDFGLDLILDGLERVQKGPDPSGSPA